MRQAIETVPSDGQVVILEDDARGIYAVARWSAEVGDWVGENGEPSKITPTHWYPHEIPFLQDASGSCEPTHVGPAASQARRYSFFSFASDRTAPQQSRVSEATAFRRFATFSIALALVAAGPIVISSRTDVVSHITRYVDQLDILRTGMIEGPASAQEIPSQSRISREAERDIVVGPRTATGRIGAPEAKISVATSALGREREQSTEALSEELARAQQALDARDQLLRELASELAMVRRELEAHVARSNKAASEIAQLKRAAGSTSALVRDLVSELATARREVEMHVAQSSKAAAEVAQIRQNAESIAAELQEALQLERGKAKLQAEELATARREIDAHAILTIKASDEAAQFKQAAESTTAELRLLLQQERARAEALAQDLESIRRWTDPRIVIEPSASNQIARVKQVVEKAAAEQPAAVEVEDSPDVARLLARASALLNQGNIGAARTVLEYAAEAGSARANFALAETYDPLILSTWGTHGTRGDTTKARDHYAKAHAGGVQEARDRLNALQQ